MPNSANDPDFDLAREISPRRKTTGAGDLNELVAEQLAHFGIDAASTFGERLAAITLNLYRAHADTKRLWQEVVAELASLSRQERVERFAAMKFLSFQLAKILDTLQNPFRRTYQSLVGAPGERLAKGPYPIFDNVTALFSSQPVITRTATYIYACAEWVEDAFQGKELLLEIYSRLLNPTSITLANQIVDIEAGPLAPEYLAWNFNSGMAAVDAIMSHLVGYQDIILSSRNIYGGTYQLLHDWYGKKGQPRRSSALLRRLWRGGLSRGASRGDAGATRPASQGPAHLRIPRIPLQSAWLRARRGRDFAYGP
jgi:hypothetical protein